MSGTYLTVEAAGCGVEVAARVNVLGVGVSALDMEDALGRSERLIRSNQHGYVCVADVHSVMEASRDSSLRKILNGSSMTLPDGMPLVWMGWFQGSVRMSRVYGPDFMLELCRRSAASGVRHFLYGGGRGVAEKLRMCLETRFPGLLIVGTYTPPFRPLTDGEEEDLADAVRAARPDVLWVGLGSPKQERFMAQHSGKLECKLMVGVGAAFDFHSGVVKEAPRWLHRTGLQWIHRVMQEPRRLGRRYLDCVPAFLWNAGLQIVGIREFEVET